MLHRLGILLAASAVLGAGPAAARADDAAKAFKDFGLLGEWRKDCAVLPALRYGVTPSGSLVQVDNLGMVIMESAVSRPERLSPTRFRYEQTTKADVRVKVTVALEKGRLRVMDMVDVADGKIRIADGKFPSGSETQWLGLCKPG